MSILFLGAHPDDIELGCAGTICYYLQKGFEIYCYHLTNGVYSDINGNSVRDFAEIQDTTEKSLGLLGVKKENIRFTDVQATELKVNKERISELQKFIVEKNIEVIFTHPDPDTYHQDHRAAHNISMASARRFVNNIFLFEIMFNFASGLMIPNYYIDISNYIEKKTEALRLHKTEYKKFGEEMWIDSIITLAKYRGMQVNAKYAEAFYVLKYCLK
ncbi:MAG: PIG-L deacetylase family protein [Candidatus Odinarchaeota archaeon]